MKPEQLAARLQGNTLGATRVRLLRRALAIAERRVKLRTPVRRGTLRRSITSREDVPGQRGTVGTNLRYARTVHQGSGPHIIRPKAGKALFWKGAAHPVRKVMHPGSRANPFLTHGLNDAQGEIGAAAAEAGETFFTGVRG